MLYLTAESQKLAKTGVKDRVKFERQLSDLQADSQSRP
jgi:hypothetical protein